MEELSIMIETGPVYARALGDAAAPLVVALHGLSKRNGWHTWEPLMAPLAAAGYRVVSIDLPGWGLSLPFQEEQLTEEQGAAVALGLIDALQPDQPGVLMGKSWGGALAISAALRQPGRVSKLILTAPAYGHFERLSSLVQPVLLAWADDDPVIPAYFVKRYQDAVRHLTVVTYPTGGHNAAQANAADFAPRAIDFLEA